MEDARTPTVIEVMRERSLAQAGRIDEQARTIAQQRDDLQKAQRVVSEMCHQNAAIVEALQALRACFEDQKLMIRYLLARDEDGENLPIDPPPLPDLAPLGGRIGDPWPIDNRRKRGL